MVDLRSGLEALKLLPGVNMNALALKGHVENQGTAIRNSQVVQNKDKTPEEWTGAAADAASAEIKSLGGRVDEVADVFLQVATPIGSWAEDVAAAESEIRSWQGDWDQAVSDYKSTVAQAEADRKNHVCTVFCNPDGTGCKYTKTGAIAPWDVTISDAEKKLEAKQEELTGKYTSKIDELDGQAGDAANSINAQRQKIVPDEVGARGRGAIGAAMFDPETMPTVSGAAQWAHAQEIAPEIADALKKRPMTLQDVKEFNEKYGEYLGNPFYATAVAEHVSMDDLNTAALAARDAGDQREADGSQHKEDSYLFNKNLGTLMVLSTGGSNLSDSMVGTQKSFDMLSDALVGKEGIGVEKIYQAKLAELKDTGWKFYPDQTSDLNKQKAWQGYDIFGMLAGYAGRENTSLTLGPRFYDDQSGSPSVFADMVKWDHDTGGWERAAVRPGAPTTSTLIPNEGIDEYKLHSDPLQSIFELSDTPDYLEKNTDAILQQSEDRRLQALTKVLNSDTLFDVDTPFNYKEVQEKNLFGELRYNPDGTPVMTKVPDPKPINMVRYLTGWRGGAVYDYGAYLDGGEVFGNMLNDASKHTPEPRYAPEPSDYAFGEDDPHFKAAQRAYDRWTVDDRARAVVAQNFMLGYQDGLDHHTDVAPTRVDKFPTGEDQFGSNNSRMRSWLGSVIAPRVGELAAALDDTEGIGGTGNATNPYTGYSMLDINNEDLKRMFSRTGLFTDLIYDQPGADTPDDLSDNNYNGRPPALQAIGDNAWAGYKVDLRRAMNVPYGEGWAENTARQTSGWQTLISGLDQALTNTGIAADDEIVQRNKTARGVIDFAVDHIPLDKLPAGAVVGLGVEVLKDPVLDAYMPTDLTEKGVAQRIHQELTTTSSIKDEVDRMFLERGGELPGASGMTKEQLDREFLRKSGAKNGLDSMASSVPSLDQLTPDQREAYLEYLGNDRPNPDFKTDLTALGQLQHEINANQKAADEFLKGARDNYSNK